MDQKTTDEENQESAFSQVLEHLSLSQFPTRILLLDENSTPFQP